MFCLTTPLSLFRHPHSCSVLLPLVFNLAVPWAVATLRPTLPSRTWNRAGKLFPPPNKTPSPSSSRKPRRVTGRLSPSRTRRLLVSIQMTLAPRLSRICSCDPCLRLHCIRSPWSPRAFDQARPCLQGCRRCRWCFGRLCCFVLRHSPQR